MSDYGYTAAQLAYDRQEPPEPPKRWLCPNSECKEWLGVGDKLYYNGKGKVIGCSCCIKSMDAEDYEW